MEIELFFKLVLKEIIFTMVGVSYPSLDVNTNIVCSKCHFSLLLLLFICTMICKPMTTQFHRFLSFICIGQIKVVTKFAWTILGILMK